MSEDCITQELITDDRILSDACLKLRAHKNVAIDPIDILSI
jgi:hypothetical protein